MNHVIIYLLIVFGLIGVSVFAFLNYVIFRAFHFEHVAEKTPPDKKTFNYRENLIPTENGKKIHIYDLNPEFRGKLTIVALHGWANNALIFLPIAEKLKNKARIFLVNARNHGKSDEEKMMTILKFEADLRHAINYVKETVGSDATIIALGHSMGAAASILTAADDDRVDGVVSISAFADIRQIMYQGFLSHRMPAWFARLIIFYIGLRLGRSLDEISPKFSIQRFQKPILLIHGTEDPLVPFDDLKILEENAQRANAESFAAHGHNHSSLLKDREVALKIKEFLEKYFTLGNRSQS
jgi:pimeloyl-ACP methyl ester carboxylesterase